MLTRQNLIPLTIIEEWLEHMSPATRASIENLLIDNNGDCLTLDSETKIKGISALDKHAKKLLEKLIQDCNGIRWKEPAPESPSQKLISLALARYDRGKGERLLKATKFAFSPEIQYLIGLTNTY